MTEALKRWTRARATDVWGPEAQDLLPHHCASVAGDCVPLAVPGLPCIPRAGVVCEKSTPRSVDSAWSTVPRGPVHLSSIPHFVLVEKWKTRFTIYYL